MAVVSKQSLSLSLFLGLSHTVNRSKTQIVTERVLIDATPTNPFIPIPTPISQLHPPTKPNPRHSFFPLSHPFLFLFLGGEPVVEIRLDMRYVEHGEDVDVENTMMTVVEASSTTPHPPPLITSLLLLVPPFPPVPTTRPPPLIPPNAILPNRDLNPLRGEALAQLRALNHAREFLGGEDFEGVGEAGCEDWGGAGIEFADWVGDCGGRGCGGIDWNGGGGGGWKIRVVGGGWGGGCRGGRLADVDEIEFEAEGDEGGRRAEVSVEVPCDWK